MYFLSGYRQFFGKLILPGVWDAWDMLDALLRLLVETGVYLQRHSVAKTMDFLHRLKG
jgi:hypothetical protein